MKTYGLRTEACSQLKPNDATVEQAVDNAIERYVSSLSQIGDETNFLTMVEQLTLTRNALAFAIANETDKKEANKETIVPAAKVPALVSKSGALTGQARSEEYFRTRNATRVSK